MRLLFISAVLATVDRLALRREVILEAASTRGGRHLCERFLRLLALRYMQIVPAAPLYRRVDLSFLRHRGFLRIAALFANAILLQKDIILQFTLLLRLFSVCLTRHNAPTIGRKSPI